MAEAPSGMAWSWTTAGSERIGLLFSLLLALAAHAVLLPSVYRVLDASTETVAGQVPEVDQSLPQAPRRTLGVGREDGLQARVAWISHDAFTELVARQSITEQPALQTQADPTPGAPLDELDPVPPDGDLRLERPAIAASTPPMLPATAPQTPFPLVVPWEPDPQVRLPPRGEADAPSLEHGPGDSPLPERSVPAEGPQPTLPAEAASGGPPRPTGADRSDRESQPTMLRLAPTVVPARNGQVVVGPGVEIKTFAPRFSAVAVASSAPGAQNPVALLTFNTDGTVLRVELLRSTGAENLDTPVITSLYRWQATGPRVDAATEPFDFEVRLLLTPEL